uniref:Secreted protein n=1 Tax=Anguilla anguilla TaxID=7936 RepID=A0A0E9Q098_ANGAN
MAIIWLVLENIFGMALYSDTLFHSTGYIFYQKYRAIYFHCVRELSVDCMQQVFTKSMVTPGVCVCKSSEARKGVA